MDSKIKKNRLGLNQKSCLRTSKKTHATPLFRYLSVGKFDLYEFVRNLISDVARHWNI